MRYRVFIAHDDPAMIEDYYDKIKSIKKNIARIDAHHINYDDEYESFMTKEQFYDLRDIGFEIRYRIIQICDLK